MARKKVSQSSLVREALANGITKPADVVAYIQKEHGVTVRVGLVHNVKSTEGKKKPGKPGRKPGRKPGPKPKLAAASSNGKSGTLTVQEITAVKGLLTRLGKDNLQEFIEALA